MILWKRLEVSSPTIQKLHINLCEVRMMVRLVFVKADNMVQECRRATGSIPHVGSSRNTTWSRGRSRGVVLLIHIVYCVSKTNTNSHGFTNEHTHIHTPNIRKSMRIRTHSRKHLQPYTHEYTRLRIYYWLVNAFQNWTQMVEVGI